MGKIPNMSKRRDASPVTMIGITAIVIVVAVVGFWLYANVSKKKESVNDFNSTMQGMAVFTVGEESAPTIDIVEDFLCPSCKQFEGAFGPEIVKKVDAGELRVRFHIVNFLDRASSSGDYSTRALAAAIHIAEKAPDSWMKWHQAMYVNQPMENGDSDMTQNQMADLAIEVGVPRDVADDLRNISKFTPAAESSATTVMDFVDENVSRVSTPMVIHDGKEIEVTSGWLERVK